MFIICIKSFKRKSRNVILIAALVKNIPLENIFTKIFDIFSPKIRQILEYTCRSEEGQSFAPWEKARVTEEAWASVREVRLVPRGCVSGVQLARIRIRPPKKPESGFRSDLRERKTESGSDRQENPGSGSYPYQSFTF